MEKIKDKIKQEVLDIKKEARNKIASYILAGLGLVAGLAWNDAIKTSIEYFFPLKSSGILAKFIYAFLITLFIVIASIYLMRILRDKSEK
jgi:hypothetical protein